MVQQILFPVVLVVIAVWAYSNLLVRAKKGQAAVIVRLGRLHRIVAPGTAVTLPGIDRVQIFDLAKEVPNWRGLSRAELHERIRVRVREMPGG